MRVVLFRSVDNLGSAGEIVDVKRGYYRNYLGPRGYAKVASRENVAEMESRRKKLEAMVARERSEAEQIAEAISGTELNYTMRSNDAGQLFGSVTSMDIARSLEDLGHVVDRRKIEMPENIKALGKFEIRIRIYPEVYAEVTAIVERELRQDEIEALEQAAETADAAGVEEDVQIGAADEEGAEVAVATEAGSEDEATEAEAAEEEKS